MMATRYDFVVDTTPMGHSIHGIADGVRTTGVTVLSSAEAIGVAEAQAAEKISVNISHGFYTLVVSQLNQKMARLRSALQAKDAQLIQERRTAEMLRGQFFRDFQMLKRRYHKLFNTLNRSLKSRVFELDKPITSVLVNGFQANIKHRNQGLALPALLTTEGLKAGQGMEISRAKQQSLKLMEAIRVYLMKTFEVQAHIEAVLMPSSSVREEIALPSLLLEYDSFAPGIRSTQFQFPGADGESQQKYQDVVQAVSNIETQESQWQPVNDSERLKVISEVEKLTGSSSLTPREIEMVRQLVSAQVPWSEMRGDGE